MEREVKYQDTLKDDYQVDIWQNDGRLSKAAIYLFLPKWRGQVIIVPKSPTCNVNTNKAFNKVFDIDKMVREDITIKVWDYFIELGLDNMKGHTHNKHLLKFEAIVLLKSMFVWHHIVLPACNFKDLEIFCKNDSIAVICEIIDND